MAEQVEGDHVQPLGGQRAGQRLVHPARHQLAVEQHHPGVAGAVLGVLQPVLARAAVEEELPDALGDQHGAKSSRRGRRILGTLRACQHCAVSDPTTGRPSATSGCARSPTPPTPSARPSSASRRSTEDDWRRRARGPVYVVEDPRPVAVGGLFDDDGRLPGLGHVDRPRPPRARPRPPRPRRVDRAATSTPSSTSTSTNDGARSGVRALRLRRHRAPRAPPTGLRPADGADGPQARLTALITALSDAVTMLASSPTPQRTSVSPSPSVIAHSTYAAAMASPPALRACSA